MDYENQEWVKGNLEGKYEVRKYSGNIRQQEKSLSTRFPDSPLLLPRSMFLIPFSSFSFHRSPSPFSVPRNPFLILHTSFPVSRSLFLVPSSLFLVPGYPFFVSHSPFPNPRSLFPVLVLVTSNESKSFKRLSLIHSTCTREFSENNPSPMKQI